MMNSGKMFSVSAMKAGMSENTARKYVEACVVICRTSKSKARKNKVIFINAVNEVTRERAQSFLTDVHIQRIVTAYNTFEPDNGFCAVATNDQIRAKDFNLSIPLYVQANNHNMVREDSAEYGKPSLKDTIEDWQQSSVALRKSMQELFDTLKISTNS